MLPDSSGKGINLYRLNSLQIVVVFFCGLNTTMLLKTTCRNY